MDSAPAPASPERTEDTSLHQRILTTFSQGWDPTLSTLSLGKTLTALGFCLGVVIAELTLRKVPWEVIDKNINKSLIRGVDRHIK